MILVQLYRVLLQSDMEIFWWSFICLLSAVAQAKLPLENIAICLKELCVDVEVPEQNPVHGTSVTSTLESKQDTIAHTVGIHPHPVLPPTSSVLRIVSRSGALREPAAVCCAFPFGHRIQFHSAAWIWKSGIFIYLAWMPDGAGPGRPGKQRWLVGVLSEWLANCLPPHLALVHQQQGRLPSCLLLHPCGSGPVCLQTWAGPGPTFWRESGEGVVHVKPPTNWWAACWMWRSSLGESSLWYRTQPLDYPMPSLL